MSDDPEQAVGRAVVAVVGCGATGARAARHLADSDAIEHVVLSGSAKSRLDGLDSSLGDRGSIGDAMAAAPSVVVLAGPPGTHVEAAGHFVAAGVHVVSVSDAFDDVEGLLALDRRARDAGVSVVTGAGFAPGLSCVLAAHAAKWCDTVDEIHVARFGTGGPACARQHHHALSSRSVDWRDGDWVRRAGGSGRELCSFPDPVGSVDCYRAALSDALLLQPEFPSAERITARQAANRRDRLTSWAPMLRKPHPEGKVGALRVEIRGRRDGTCVNEIVGVIDRPAVAAGAVAGIAARWAVTGRLRRSGAGGLAGMVTPVEFLHELAGVGIRAAVFVGLH